MLYHHHCDSKQVVLKEHGNHDGGKSAINHQNLEYVASSPTQPSSRVRCDVVLKTGMYVVVPVVFNADTHNAVATPRYGSHSSVMVDSIVLCFYATQPLLITELRTLPCVVEQALVGRIKHQVRRTTNCRNVHPCCTNRIPRNAADWTAEHTLSSNMSPCTLHLFLLRSPCTNIFRFCSFLHNMFDGFVCSFLHTYMHTTSTPLCVLLLRAWSGRSKKAPSSTV